ncbi:uncharacterized protein LOC18437646 isoform X2 [Amborella trichopoda]|uniref:uncharacterized protein LOC18437646 isoform X2 n=1 Tax=Amborella trichopoda TaxID=13333 RepID=UPI0009BCE6BE|nr:uncharacterized protein LOC18437646 isoform X2 [Amborella trichopoda]|eukprot:XP_020525318.1 uncharacterized protein LOC18437646 isoform X2 [Amborella trichopoda]
MDSMVSSVLEEICIQGTAGCPLANLWTTLQPYLSRVGLHLCDGVKQVIWKGVLNIPGLVFKANGQSFSSNDPSIQQVQESENLGLSIVAPEHLRDCCLGLYDYKASDAGLSSRQRFILERLAKARTSGITQSELSKELHKNGSQIFYDVKSLECRGLLVRQSTVVRTKDTGMEEENNLKASAVVNTNLIHLSRYSKHLNLSSQQKVEIMRPDPSEGLQNTDGCSLTGIVVEGGVKGDVLIKDYLPAMRAVCDLLEEASNNVLVVSDLKRALGYRMTSKGHRTWRKIFKMLKSAQLVEDFRAEIDGKVVHCIRLAKKFKPSALQPNPTHSIGDDSDVNLPSKRHISEQLVELPIDNQMYDMIDAEGSTGLVVTEMWKRLGLNNKKNLYRRVSMCRFGVQFQDESHKRSMQYRAWTSRHLKPGSDGPVNDKAIDEGNDHLGARYSQMELVLHEQASPRISMPYPNPSDECTTHNMSIVKTENVEFHDVHENSGGCEGGQISHEIRDAHIRDDDVVRQLVRSNQASKTASCISSKSAERRPDQRYPRLAFRADASAQREQRILERLKVEKFIPTAELHKWLGGLEKEEKSTTMARKTLTRSLKKLQEKGQCKCITVAIPVVTNCKRSRTTEVVLHPSIDLSQPGLMGQIHDRVREFEMQSRCQGLQRLKSDEPVPLLSGVKRTKPVAVDSQAVRVEAMRVNGFVPGKMFRAKLLHNFLWDYVSSLPDWNDALYSCKNDHKDPKSTCKLFELDVSVRAMPIELFLQVIGSVEKFEDLIESCRHRLCLSDLPEKEYKSLMNSQATGRLSRLIDILRRLKLLQLVNQEHKGELVKMVPYTILTHAFELRPYIEEPLARAEPSLGVNLYVQTRQVRHDFILSNRDAVDAYWKTLEYCYSAADPIEAAKVFPGSAVPEVLRVSYDRNRKVRLQPLLHDSRKSAKRKVSHLMKSDIGIHASKKKKTSENTMSRLPLVLPNLASNDSAPSEKDAENQTIQNFSHAFPHDHDEYRIDNSINEDEDMGTFINQFTHSKLKSSRKKKFQWSDGSDRRLVIQYARYRVALGAKFNRVDWTTIPDLPAPPDTCRRRMAILRQSGSVRRALMSLCNLLADRYVKQLNETSAREVTDGAATELAIHESNIHEFHWDDFDEPSVKLAVEEVIRSKKMKLDATKRIGPKSRGDVGYLQKNGDSEAQEDKSSQSREVERCSSIDLANNSLSSQDPKVNLELASSSYSRDQVQKSSEISLSNSQMVTKVGPNSSPYLKFLHKQEIPAKKSECVSLAVANAVELIKLVFLNSSATTEVPNLLVDSLRRFNEKDIFAAFNYLKAQKFVVPGRGIRPFVLSPKFFQDASSSPFPVSTGQRSAKFASWVSERKEDLLQEGVNLPSDMHCGEVFHLCALVSSGEFFIFPKLPNKGVGDAEGMRALKRKSKGETPSDSGRFKKLKLASKKLGELRREKGFPGIKVVLNSVMIPAVESLEFCLDSAKQESSSMHVENEQSFSGSCFRSGAFTEELPSNEPLWDSMAKCAKLLSSLVSSQPECGPMDPKTFETVYFSIHKAGEDGLDLGEVDQLISDGGTKITQVILDVLQVHRLVVKVNAFDHIRVLASSFGAKYSLHPISPNIPNTISVPNSNPMTMDGQSSETTSKENVDRPHVSNQNIYLNLSDGRTVIVLDELEPDVETSTEPNQTDGADNALASSNGFWPILPWLNGDGGTDSVMYKSLMRRVVGIVMQNPGILEDDIVRRFSILNPQVQDS